MRARSLAAGCCALPPPPLAFLAMPADAPAPDDPYLWLEDVRGDKALAWVRERNAETLKQIVAREPDFAHARARLLDVLNSRDRIPMVGAAATGSTTSGRTPITSAACGAAPRWPNTASRQPAQWETVIDLDALGAAEKENWVWGGAECLGPDYRRCLVSLSRGGADAKVIREFDTVAKRFVDGGFRCRRRSRTWPGIDADTLIVGTDFGPGSMTDSGLPARAEALEARHAAGRRDDDLRGAPKTPGSASASTTRRVSSAP